MKKAGHAAKVWRLELRRRECDAPNPKETVVPPVAGRPPSPARRPRRLAPLPASPAAGRPQLPDSRLGAARCDKRVAGPAASSPTPGPIRLLLAIGEYEENRLPEAERHDFVKALLKAYRDEPDPGVRGAGEWVLQHWGHRARLSEVLVELQKSVADAKPDPARRWWVNSCGQTFVRIAAPVEFMMGSPESEMGRKENETYHRQRIARPYAIATKEVTVEEYLRFDPKFRPAHLGLLRQPQWAVVNMTGSSAASLPLAERTGRHR